MLRCDKMFQLDNGVYIVEIPKKVDIIREAQIISDYTVNTWQADRHPSEKEMNTQNGKRAEQAVKQVLRHLKIVYLPYDNFRTDNFKKHAPFDGLIFNEFNEVKSYLDKINAEIKNGKYGKVSSETLDDLINAKIFPVEIKSTQVSERHLPHNAKRYQLDNNIFNEISKNIQNKDDFLTYPHFIRSSQETVSLQWYFKKIQERYPKCKTLDTLLQFEKKNQAYFHIRVYQQRDVFFVLKFIDRNEFFDIENLVIKKMYQTGKSEKAVYFTKSMRHGHTIEKITNYL